MGNSQSNERENGSGSGSGSKGGGSAANSPVNHRHVARRRESTHHLHSHATAPAPPPTTQLIATTSSASHATQPTRAHAHAIAASSSSPSHTRARSITAAGDAATRLRSNDSAGSQRSTDSSIMGSENSKQQRPPSRATTLPIPTTPAAPLTSDAASDEKSRSSPSPSVRPVDVPTTTPSFHRQPDPEKASYQPGPTPSSGSPYGLPPSHYSRPPRLPLPIEEEVHAPGSPIITPQDISSPIGREEVDGLPRRASVLSSTTADDEDVADNEAFLAEQSSLAAPAVPTKIEWNGGGEKIYVTGTFVQWDRKFKLHRNKDGKPGFSAVLQLKPGTHHLKFLVDQDMTTSNQLPTTVDYTNILVNYIEVVAPLPVATETQPPAPAEPMPIPGAAKTLGQPPGTADGAKELDIRTVRPASETGTETASSTIQPGTSSKAVPIPQSATLKQPTHDPSREETQGKPLPRTIIPRPNYTNQIPQFLLDLDSYSEPESERFQRASRVIGTLPQPPTLPMFLSKSILNGATPHKDDASVLVMPNHTVLNHLATSSIKSGVLATSGTTRYKRKFLTTIMYKPTSNDDG